MKTFAGLVAFVFAAVAVQAAPTSSGSSSGGAKTSSTSKSSSQAAPSSYGNKLTCWNQAQGDLVIGTYHQDAKNYPNTHVHAAAAGVNNSPLLSKSGAATYVEYHPCNGYKSHKGSDPKNNEYFGQVKVGNQCLTRVNGQQGVDKGLTLRDCATTDGSTLERQWIRGTYQNEFFELKPTLNNVPYERIDVINGYHDAINFSLDDGTLQKLAIKY